MKRVLFVLALLLSASLPVAAQESGQVGIAMGYPASIGIIWHASDRVAIRPEFNFTHSSVENSSETVSGLKSGGWALGAGASALFYTSTHDKLRTYVSPRFAYARTTSTNSGSSVSTSDSTSNTYQFFGSFGAQYTPTRRFSIYGEVGVGYSTADSTFTSTLLVVTPNVSASTGTSTSHSFGTRTAVGVIFYCK